MAGITVRNPALIPDKGILLVSKGILLEIKGILLLSRGILTIRRFVTLDPPFRDPRNAVSLLSVRRCVFFYMLLWSYTSFTDVELHVFWCKGTRGRMRVFCLQKEKIIIKVYL